MECELIVFAAGAACAVILLRKVESIVKLRFIQEFCRKHRVFFQVIERYPHNINGGPTCYSHHDNQRIIFGWEMHDTEDIWRSKRSFRNKRDAIKNCYLCCKLWTEPRKPDGSLSRTVDERLAVYRKHTWDPPWKQKKPGKEDVS